MTCGACQKRLVGRGERENRRKKEKGEHRVQALQEERMTYFDCNRLSLRLSVSKCGADWIMSQQCTFERDKVKVCSCRSLALSHFLSPYITQSITHSLILCFSLFLIFSINLFYSWTYCPRGGRGQMSMWWNIWCWKKFCANLLWEFI